MFEHVQPAIGTYLDEPLGLCDPDPRAGDVARQVAALIASELPQLRVEHVGSTAVPRCPGRGIVDLMIALSQGEMPSLAELLDRLGFQLQPGNRSFLADRPLYAGSLSHEGATFNLLVYLLPADAPEADSMRFLRTCLRADPELHHAYVATKRAILASGVTDPAEYCRQKSEFLKQVLG